MTGVIIAGGLGTRLRSVVADKPKCLASVNGQPFLLRLLAQMADAGINNILLCTGYGADQIQSCVGNSYRGIPVVYSREDQPLGTGGALALAYSRYGTGNPWLVMNGDSYLELNLGEFERTFAASSAVGAIAAVHVPDGRRFGALRYGVDGRILAFEEKSDSPGAKWINGGVYLLSSRLLSTIPPVPVSLERDLFPRHVETGLLAFLADGRFIDIGLPESFAEAQTFFRTPECGTADLALA